MYICVSLVYISSTYKHTGVCRHEFRPGISSDGSALFGSPAAGAPVGKLQSDLKGILQGQYFFPSYLARTKPALQGTMVGPVYL